MKGRGRRTRRVQGEGGRRTRRVVQGVGASAHLEEPAVRDVCDLLLQHDDLLQPQVPQLDVREDRRLDLEHLVRRLDLEDLRSLARGGRGGGGAAAGGRGASTWRSEGPTHVAGAEEGSSGELRRTWRATHARREGCQAVGKGSRLDRKHLLAAVLEQVERLRDARLDLARVLRRRELLELDVAVREQPEGEGLPQACEGGVTQL